MDLAQKTVRLYPTPDTAGVLRLRVWRMPLASELMVKDADVPVIPAGCRRAAPLAAHEAYLVKDQTRTTQHAAPTTCPVRAALGSRPSLHDMACWADSPPRVRLANMF
jgi:hypothetical protein